ncbi:MAG: hypothetical protein RJS98_06995 [Rhodospirillaceae bacterium]
MNNAPDMLRTAASFFENADYLTAVDTYSDLLKHHPGFVQQHFKNRQNKILHNELAKHSLLQQGLSQRHGKGFHINVSSFLLGGGRISVPEDSAKAITKFKGEFNSDGNCAGYESEVWVGDVRRAFSRYGSTLLAGVTDMSKADLSPIYLSEWVLNDFLQIEPYIPKEISKIADIGCGLAAIDLFINQTSDSHKVVTLYDIHEDFLVGAKHLLAKNNLESVFGRDGSNTSPDDMIVSTRSCCFLYGYQEYESVFRQTRKGSSIVVDIGPEYFSETMQFFRGFCEYAIPIETTGANNHRYVFIR